jgi:hypothetical protein
MSYAYDWIRDNINHYIWTPTNDVSSVIVELLINRIDDKKDIDLESVVKNKTEVAEMNRQITSLLSKLKLSPDIKGLQTLNSKLTSYFNNIYPTDQQPGKYYSLQTWRWGKLNKDETVDVKWKLRSSVPELIPIITDIISKLDITSKGALKSKVKKEDEKKTIPVLPNPMPYRKKTINKQLRMEIWDTFIGSSKEGLCLCCSRTSLDRDNFECGHILAERNGGDISIQNLRPICSTCNGGMGTINMLEYMNQKRYLIPSNWNGISNRSPSELVCVCSYSSQFLTEKSKTYNGRLYSLFLKINGQQVDIHLETLKKKYDLNVPFNALSISKTIRTFIDIDSGYLTANTYPQHKVINTFDQVIALYMVKKDDVETLTTSMANLNMNNQSPYFKQSFKSNNYDDIFLQLQEALIRA